MKNVLLLNPPGEKLYIRDYYCSKVSQADYIFPSVDLLFLSGRLHGHYRVTVIDAIAERLLPDDVLNRIEGKSFAAVVILVGSVSWEEDAHMISRLRTRLKDSRFIATGDVVLDAAGQKGLQEYADLDAYLLDFTNADILHYLSGQIGVIENMTFRDGDRIRECRTPRTKREEMRIPVPRHELFPLSRYRHPFARRTPLSCILTDFGCPFRCSFCIMASIGFKYRPVEDVLEELQHIVSLGIKELFWVDQTFGAVKERNKDLCRRIIAKKLDIGWFSFSRVDVVDYELLSLMKEAGCHTVIFGVESANERILKHYRKGYTKKQIIQAFTWCDRLGIDTAGTFILGLPEETEESARETIEFARSLPCDYASFNVAVPRFGTDLRKEAIATGVAGEDLVVMDQSGTTVAMPSKSLTQERIGQLKSRAVRRFYLRPSYLFRRLRRLRSWSQLLVQIQNSWNLLRNFMV